MKLPPDIERRVRWDALTYGFNAALISAVVFVLIEFRSELTRWVGDGIIAAYSFFQ